MKKKRRQKNYCLKYELFYLFPSTTSVKKGFNLRDVLNSTICTFKVEEMGRRKDAERRKRREQRMAERLQQTKSNLEMYDVVQGQEEEMEKSPVEYHEASQTQSDETNNSDQTNNQTSEISKRKYFVPFPMVSQKRE